MQALDFDRYDILKVLENQIGYEYLLIMETLIFNIENNMYNTTKGSDGKTYYIMSMPKITQEDKRFTTNPDNVFRKLRILTEKGYFTLIKGKWQDNKVGYTQTAIRVNNSKLKELLK